MTAHEPSSPPARVRPLAGSVARIGSMLNTEYGDETSDQLTVGGCARSSKRSLYVDVSDMNIALPLFQLTPSDGSPAFAALDSAAGAAETTNPGAPVPKAAVAAPEGTAAAAARHTPASSATRASGSARGMAVLTAGRGQRGAKRPHAPG